MKAIFKRELHAYFTSPMTYFIMGTFLVLTGWLFWMSTIDGRSVEFANVLNTLTVSLILFVPMLTMKLLSDDKKNGTEVLIRTTPIKMWKVVLGKYFSAFSIFILMVAITLICPLIISFNMTDISGNASAEVVFPFAKTIGGYVGFILLGAAYISIGVLASSLSDNSAFSAGLAMVILLLLFLLEYLGSWFGGIFGRILVWLSLSSRYDNFSTGLFSLTSVVYYLSFVFVVLFITVVNLERKRWN